MRAINPYINFNGQCREAMTFYQQCLGGELELKEVKDAPVPQSGIDKKDRVFHSSLTIRWTPLIMGTDMQDQNGYIKGNDIALGIGCSSEQEILTLFENLSTSGKVKKPIKEEFWGGIFGSVEDQFGIVWFLNYYRK